jgi:hypothetical protein
MELKIAATLIRNFSVKREHLRCVFTRNYPKTLKKIAIGKALDNK